MAGASLGHQEVPDAQVGEGLMLKSDCAACHQVNAVSVGPSFTAVASKYQNQSNAIAYLATKILKGSSGVWGEIVMPAHASMPEGDAQKIAQYVLSLGNRANSTPSLPVQGQILPATSTEANSTFVINASYTDAGSAGVKPLTATETAYLRNSILNARELTQRTRMNFKDSTATGLIGFPQANGWLKLSGIDLTGIASITMSCFNGLDEGAFSVEIRLDQDDGKLIGSTDLNSGGTQGQLNSLIKLQDTGDTKLHDVYIIFKSNQPSKRRPFLQSIKFNSI
jgi:cytochrome c551/c552